MELALGKLFTFAATENPLPKALTLSSSPQARYLLSLNYILILIKLSATE